MVFWGVPRFNLLATNSDTRQPAWNGRVAKNCPLYISISNIFIYIEGYLYMCAFSRSLGLSLLWVSPNALWYFGYILGTVYPATRTTHRVCDD